MNQQIIFTPDIQTIWHGRDTILAGFSEAPIKMVVWYDSLDCASCEVSQMFRWDNITAHAELFAEWFSIFFSLHLKKPRASSPRLDQGGD